MTLYQRNSFLVLDGGGALILASSRFLEKKATLNRGNHGKGDVVILGGGEGSGPLFPPSIIDESMFSCEFAARNAYFESQLEQSDIDFFGLYDCFPICLLRAVEAVGIAEKGRGGECKLQFGFKFLFKTNDGQGWIKSTSV